MITSNQIEFSERLEQQFQHNWSMYVGQSDVFQPRVGTPFWHLNNESFWQLVLMRVAMKLLHASAGKSVCPRHNSQVDSLRRD